MKTIAPYGTWQSDITGSFVAAQSLRIGNPLFLGDRLLWLEARPAEQGRQVVVIKQRNGEPKDLLPSPWSARSKVHEYGGGAYTALGNTLYFVNGQDQQLYSMAMDTTEPIALTHAENCRFADLSLNKDQTKLIAVCEKHSNQTHEEPENFLVCLDLTNTAQPVAENQLTRIADGHDFYSNPRISPCGKWLSYISWDHPNMPWDDTQLWLQNLESPSQAVLIVGGTGQSHNEGESEKGESIVQPLWSPNGNLFWVSDKSNWWNIYCLSHSQLHKPESAHCIYKKDAEFATPPWVFGMSSYVFINADSILASYTENGLWHIIELKKNKDEWLGSPVKTDLCYFSELAGGDNQAVFSAASASSPADLYLYKNSDINRLSLQKPVATNAQSISMGRIICFPTGNGNAVAHGVFYPPKNADYDAPDGTKPPVIVFGHGGPTGACDAFFRHKIQFWTQRGFAVLEVNYRGSTGYGRRFRHALQNQWGVYDVEDLSAGAEYATQQGWVHPQQRVIRGSSAGGFSVLAALTDTNTFNAGCSLYGVGDLETLASDTHKFESRYLDGLIGPYPAEKERYIERSPIHKVNQITCPIMVFQGAEDKVVPPEQAEQIVSAATKQGLPVGYVLYRNEGHGFRRAENIEHQADTELYFYQKVLKLKTFNDSESPLVKIINMADREE